MTRSRITQFILIIVGFIAIYSYVNIHVDHADEKSQNLSFSNNQDKDFTFSYNEKDKTASIINYHGQTDDIKVPDTINYKNNVYYVTTIKKNAFKNINVNSVTISSSIKRIEANSFDQATISTIYLNNEKVDGRLFLTLNHLMTRDSK